MQEQSFGREQSSGRGCWWPGEGSSLQSHTEETKLNLEASLKSKGRNHVVGKHIREERKKEETGEKTDGTMQEKKTEL